MPEGENLRWFCTLHLPVWELRCSLGKGSVQTSFVSYLHDWLWSHYNFLASFGKTCDSCRSASATHLANRRWSFALALCKQGNGAIWPFPCVPPRQSFKQPDGGRGGGGCRSRSRGQQPHWIGLTFFRAAWNLEHGLDSKRHSESSKVPRLTLNRSKGSCVLFLKEGCWDVYNVLVSIIYVTMKWVAKRTDLVCDC